MRYSRVYIDALGHELAPVVVTSLELEDRLGGLYESLHFQRGQLEAITGIAERRWWEPGYSLTGGATTAGRYALAQSNVRAADLDVVIYAGIYRELFEPATACRVAAALGVGPDTEVYDVSNACLGVLNGMVAVANRIELGQARAGLVVSCETARDIADITIERLLEAPTMENFRLSLAALTGGSGAVAVLLSDGSFSAERRRRLLGGATRSAPQFHELCRWGIERLDTPSRFAQFTCTDAAAVLKHGVDLGESTWAAFLRQVGWAGGEIDKFICHQVGSTHREAILRVLKIDEAREFSTYPYLGNIGTVSLPITAALAEDREFLRPGDRVAFLGIGSGLSCLMLGLEW